VRHNGRTLSKEEARHGRRRAGRWPVQLRFECALTGAEYVSQQGWQEASLPRCPLHPQGGCGFARHGTYPRVSPPGTRVARWYCPAGHTTFSLLPDCLAARLSGTLAEVEAVVRAAEAASSREALCAVWRLEVGLAGALRWIDRRVQHVHTGLHLLRGLLPETFAEAAPTLSAFAAHLGLAEVLVALRGIAAQFLSVLPKPLGFCPGPIHGPRRVRRLQHRAGADPPGLSA